MMQNKNMQKTSVLDHQPTHLYDYLVFIGRFQPFHTAHQEVIEIALSMSQHVILVLGSAQNERSIKNPFSIQERQEMILQSFDQETQKRLIFVPIIDLYDDEKWVHAVKQGVAEIVDANVKIGLIGHFKDDSSYYLRLFPEWCLVELDNLQNHLSATPLREKYYEGQIDQSHFPTNVQQFLKDFQKTKWYAQLQHHYKQHDYSIIEN